ncbi:CHY zinc finger protein [Antrihabitans cavernicola]|uniref:TetR family transcriptional regulator n=1 Tax=Antrihabitans cavernicola TaxID=2495913 RepID=A0A5A7S509_9NOCA|nr:CHY zinc finger protein [Spelaeibacter cavernicola]KAA0021258.1 TetR family transcriptional regulator [Spelaeibacter cavernicola]
MSTPNPGHGVYRGRTLDDRVEKRRSQLVDAALTLIGDSGTPAVTMRAVTRTAELSPRYFYESFDGRAALLQAVFDATMARFQAEVDKAISAASIDPLDQTRAAIAAVCEMLESDARTARFLREAMAEEALRDKLPAALPRFIATASMQLTDETWYRRADPTRLQLDISALAGALTNLFLDWTDGRFDITRGEFVDYCTAMVTDVVRRRQSRAAPSVFGPVVDGQTRCVHYRTELDIVAIQFACCKKFYPCYQCHDECEAHPREVWPSNWFDEEAILCGACSTRISIATYLNVSTCPHCGAVFNPGCKLHSELYFDTGAQ